ncbi:replication-relaxation family protein [Sphaerisporangium sp. NPDC051017]|uniref:replication-relaxation family protein n=1 Tax=Sphaerisporangium sp. NPDC051017 TaxID=3154636 RepID=UPI003412040D
MPAVRIPLGLPRFDADAMAQAAARLTPRDYHILEHLLHHRVLTTHQLERLFFTKPQPTRRRLGILHKLHTITRYRPWTPYGGSAPCHWVLGRAGAELLALRSHTTVKELGYHPDLAMSISVSAKSGHQIGVNDFFVHLCHLARHTPGSHLRAWLSEKQCATSWGGLARPDAFGCWSENGRQIDFFLEHDTGSMTLTKVADKLATYADLAEATQITTPVLFWLPSRKRETNLRAVITTTELPIATAVQTDLDDGPAGPCWLPLHRQLSQLRMRLAELLNAWPHLTLGRSPEQPTTATAVSDSCDHYLDSLFPQDESK